MKQTIKKPKIGITTYGVVPDESFSLPKDYVDAIIMAGGMPYLLPPSQFAAGEVLNGLDGLILSGGGDIHPDKYGGQHHKTIYKVDPERDDFEFDLARFVIESGLPCLAICRGCQMINVVQGGTLYEHIPDYFGENVLHRHEHHKPALHAITIANDTKLAGIFEQKTIEVSSWHHRAVKTLGKELVVVAKAPDEVIEAIEMPTHPWLVGVQWHPEHTAKRDLIQFKIFKAFQKFIKEGINHAIIK